MNKIELKIKQIKIQIVINKYKIILGNEFVKYNIIQTIKNYFNKSSLNEYESINEINKDVRLNESIVDTKQISLIEINEHYSIDNDLKLNSKSLILKYYETLLENIEYNETIQTINLLLKQFNEESIENICINENITINNEFIDLNSKQIIKLLNPILLINQLESNEYNLDYNEKIIFQMNLLNEISKKDLQKKYIVLMNIPLLSKQILNQIKDSNNIIYLIFTNNISSNIYFSDLVICDDMITDLFDDESIYEMMLNSNKNISVEQQKSEIINHILNKYFNTNYKIQI